MSYDKTEQELLKRFGKWVAYTRKMSQMTQQQLAEKADLSVMAVAYIEGGKRWPRLGTLNRLAQALEIPIEGLFVGLEKN